MAITRVEKLKYQIFFGKQESHLITMSTLPYVPGLPSLREESYVGVGDLVYSIRGCNKTLFDAYWAEFQAHYSRYITRKMQVLALHPSRAHPEKVQWCVIFYVDFSAPFVSKNFPRPSNKEEEY